MSQSPIVFFCDGSARNNGKQNARAGYAIYFPDFPEHQIAERVPFHLPQTNNCAEYLACLTGLQQCDIIDPEKNYPVSIYTDSELLINSMTVWIKRWKQNGWKTSTNAPVANVDLLQQIDILISQRKSVKFNHVEAHTGRQDWKSKYNEIVDKMARATTADTSTTPPLTAYAEPHVQQKPPTSQTNTYTTQSASLPTPSKKSILKIRPISNSLSTNSQPRKQSTILDLLEVKDGKYVL